MGGEGCFGESAELQKLKFDIYCPAMDISDCKSPHRLNYLKVSCDERLENKLCKFKPCQFRKIEVVKYDYTHHGYGILRTSQGRWAIHDTDDVKVGGAYSVPKCKEIINDMMEGGEFNDTRLHR
jgi:hypothetical protein